MILAHYSLPRGRTPGGGRERSPAIATLPLIVVGPLVALSLLLISPRAQAADDATATIDTLHETLIEIMKEAEQLGFQGRSARVTSTVEVTFDLDFMAAKSLGAQLKKLETTDRKRWVDTFKRFVVSNLARQFDSYSGQRFETVGVLPAPRDTVIVQTVLVRKSDEDVKLHYRLREVPDASAPGAVNGSNPAPDQNAAAGSPDGSSVVWKIIDIYSNGTVSELALRRSEFSSLLKREGFEVLVETVNNKAAKE